MVKKPETVSVSFILYGKSLVCLLQFIRFRFRCSVVKEMRFIQNAAARKCDCWLFHLKASIMSPSNKSWNVPLWVRGDVPTPISPLNFAELPFYVPVPVPVWVPISVSEQLSFWRKVRLRLGSSMSSTKQHQIAEHGTSQRRQPRQRNRNFHSAYISWKDPSNLVFFFIFVPPWNLFTHRQQQVFCHYVFTWYYFIEKLHIFLTGTTQLRPVHSQGITNPPVVSHQMLSQCRVVVTKVNCLSNTSWAGI